MTETRIVRIREFQYIECSDVNPISQQFNDWMISTGDELESFKVEQMTSHSGIIHNAAKETVETLFVIYSYDEKVVRTINSIPDK